MPKYQHCHTATNFSTYILHVLAVYILLQTSTPTSMLPMQTPKKKIGLATEFAKNRIMLQSLSPHANIMQTHAKTLLPSSYLSNQELLNMFSSYIISFIMSTNYHLCYL